MGNYIASRGARLAEFLKKLTAATQTWLTIFVTTLYNFVLVWGVYADKLPFKDYIFAVGPVNAMVMAFWLGRENGRSNPVPGSDEDPNPKP